MVFLLYDISSASTTRNEVNVLALLFSDALSTPWVKLLGVVIGQGMTRSIDFVENAVLLYGFVRDGRGLYDDMLPAVPTEDVGVCTKLGVPSSAVEVRARLIPGLFCL